MGGVLEEYRREIRGTLEIHRRYIREVLEQPIHTNYDYGKSNKRYSGNRGETVWNDYLYPQW